MLGNRDIEATLQISITIIAIVLTPVMATGQECNIIYVTPSGAGSGPTDKSNPANLQYGLSLVDSANNQLHLSSGLYTLTSPLIMVSGVTIEGGFTDTSWEKSNSTATILFRDASNVQTYPNRLVAVACVEVTDFRLQDLDIIVANAVGDGVTTYGVYLDNCANYSIVRCNINSGNGSNGLPGAAGGMHGIVGASGMDGETGDGNGPCCTLGGLGGDSSFVGSFAGGKGGDGGVRGTGTSSCFGPGNEAPDGYKGEDGQGSGTGGGIGGNGGQGSCPIVCVSFGCDAGPANGGFDGTTGTNGTPGNDGGFGVSGFGAYFIRGDGQDGQNGNHGSGGGGGGGGGSQGCVWSLFGNPNGAGAGGGGGGEGGQGGFGGPGGLGGGASFGLYIYSNGANSEILQTSLEAGQPGFGASGTQGGGGGAGGAGGIGNSSDCDLGDPGDGGTGGAGGYGGNGGLGANGTSLSLYQDTSGIPIQTSNLSGVLQPNINIKYSGCVNTPVIFTTDTFGALTWNFGAGSNPSTGSGGNSSTSYTTEGRKTITLRVGTTLYTYSDYIRVDSSDSVTAPTILTSSAGNFCQGDTGYFSSAETAINYLWTVHTGLSTDTFEGPGYQSLIYPFDSAGTYTVSLSTEDGCCGYSSLTDTLYAVVDPILKPEITIESSDSSNAACEGNELSFQANLVNGNDPVFEWYINGVPIGIDTISYSSTTFIDTDMVMCVVINNQGCALGISDTSNKIFVNIIDLPSVGFSANPLMVSDLTDTVFFTNNSTNATSWNWDFGDPLSMNNFSNLENPSHYYANNGAYNVQLIAF
ncbi:MAG: hypothetical protein JKX73_01980, partial [Flavobacteriales bacterium]|nr:hypothetical protein [Flavobacteriales bacterium]